MSPVTDLAENGRTWLRNALSAEELNALRHQSEQDQRPGTRLSSAHPLFQTLEKTELVKQIARYWPRNRLVRLISFDKSGQDKGAPNWSVPWHQDRIITVQTKHDTAEFSNWSNKSGIWHCEPPAHLLAEMLFVRIHLDGQTEENGAMEIAVGSHRSGAIGSEDAPKVAESFPRELTLADPGDVLILSMLTLHRSRPPVSDSRRRVLRADFAPFDLPPPLRWAV
jgi:hypothetical protein